jgi:F0F1-type ATP synthase membrane subunit a
MEPIHQFEIKTLFPIAKIGNVEIAFTNSALFMLIAVGIIALLMIGITSRRAMLPDGFRPSLKSPTNLSPRPCKALLDERE